VVTTTLDWARRLQAIAQSGLAWDPSEYDRERYEQVRRVAAEMAANGGDADRFERIFEAEEGHATPKVDVRGVAFRDDRILLVQERVGEAWSLPGGWVDVGESPGEAVAREVLEESGYTVRPVKLLGVHDRDRRSFSPHLWHIWKLFFLCELEEGERQALGYETLDAQFFRPGELPEPLRFGDATRAEIERCFEQRVHPEWAAEFD
jgi:ADP-ribose pyrophosphatase YjhB (NUDIX family)